MTFTKKESLEARRELKRLFKEFETQTVFVVQRGVSRSGMTRWLDLYLIPSGEAIVKNHEKWKSQYNQTVTRPHRITYTVAKALQWTYNENREALVVSGCGMDMHFHTVYTLSCVLFCNKHYNHDKAYYLKHESI